MGIKEKAKEVVDRTDDFIAEKGLGSSYLEKARTAQRNLNFAAAAASVVVIAGVAIWLVARK
ncbi:hypothetical protein [Halocola ammonii]